MYKLRIYNNKGELDHEEFFTRQVDMLDRYDIVFNSCNVAPSAWACIDNEWCRIVGY